MFACKLPKRLSVILSPRYYKKATVRSNAVLAVEHLMTFSPDFLDIHKEPSQTDKPAQLVCSPEDGAKLAGFRDRAMEWLSERYGKENVVNAVLHFDEQTPHIHATVTPIDQAGKLNCRAMLGDRQKMRDMQISLAAKLAPLGLQRGVEGSQAQYQEVKRFYGLVKELNPQLEQEAQRQVAQQRIRQAGQQHSRGGIGR
ncbi:hypothetical protein DNI29_21830 [Hymenobacter sediminis]|uniref:MobV family relaxase n=1 Tax=Hymenobacter sediminis TaxID=2218621 RepID=UPI000DA66A82|nr:MobV family relaxase [Hymenobacter sediminis]RPD44349.1 hypothetical protein DNI29_21830 [Hymenobacter sediminis]